MPKFSALDDYQKEATGKINFGVNCNSKVCSCGKHQGVGEWTPEERAKAYAWHRDKAVNYDKLKRDYLESYEKEHGSV